MKPLILFKTTIRPARKPMSPVTANGYAALYRNTADNNTATGFAALYHNTTGHDNAAFGNGALANNTIGYASVAAGRNALFNNTEGTQNVAIGAGALFGNTTGIFNIALGWGAGSNLTTGDNNIDIFSNGVAGDDSTIRIGIAGLHTATYIAGISGVTVAGGIPVIVDAGGHLGTIVSSQRFKDQIKPMDEASEAILALKPVTFRYKQELDPKGIPQFGLVAEEVAEVNPDLVVRDENGDIYTVRYEAVNAMLLNEFLKAHRKVEQQQAIIGRLETAAAKQEATIAELKSTVAKQETGLQAITARLEEQAAQIQKVSAQIEMNEPAPGTVANK